MLFPNTILVTMLWMDLMAELSVVVCDLGCYTRPSQMYITHFTELFRNRALFLYKGSTKSRQLRMELLWTKCLKDVLSNKYIFFSKITYSPWTEVE